MNVRAAYGSGFALLCAIWGSTWLAIKVGLESTPAFFGASFRFAIAAGVLALVTVVARAHLPRNRTEWLLAVLAGVLLFTADYGLLYWAENNGVPSGLTAVLFATMPLLTAVAAHVLVRDEPLTRQKLAGISLGLLGIVLIFRGQLTISGISLLAPMLAVVAASSCAAVVTAAERRWGRSLDPVGFNVVAMAIGSACLASVSLAARESWALPPWPTGLGALVYLALAGSVITFVIWNWMLRTVPATSMSFVAMITPIVALFLGASLNQEGLEPLDLLGSATVILGIYLSSSKRVGTWIRGLFGSRASGAPEGKR